MKALMRGRLWKARRGAIAVMMIFLILFVLIGMLALAIDIGYIVLTRTQLHVTADASALAGGTELTPGLGFNKTKTPEQVETAADAQAVAYAALHPNGDRDDTFADPDRDVELRTAWFDPDTGEWEMSDPGVIERHNGYNAVTVTLRRDQVGSANGDTPLPLFFGPFIGTDTSNLTARATAAILPTSGFRIIPGSGATSSIIPFAYRSRDWYRRRDAQTWYDANGRDPSEVNPDIVYTAQEDPNDPYDDHLGYPIEYNSANPLFYGYVTQGSNQVLVREIWDNYTHTQDSANARYGLVDLAPDGVLEVDLYPENIGEPGNSGTIDLGETDNSTTELIRQILNGLDENDWAAMEEQGMLIGGELTFLDEGDPIPENELPDAEGDTGISAGLKSALESIIDQPRAMLLFTEVQDPGNNATFTLVGFAGVAIMDVQLTGNPKHVWIQPAVVKDSTAVVDEDGTIGENTLIFSPLILIE